jgi:hypothetical protein
MRVAALYLACVASAAACVSPETEVECRAAVAAEGLSEGGCGFAFTGDYGAGRGCYTYASGTYEGCGYWSTSGDPSGEPGGSRVRVCAAAEECNKNKHCEAGSFCACNTGSGECTDKDSVCQTCASMGKPSFEPGTVACERYERGCGLTCDGSNYEASQACPGDRVWLDCGTACEKVCGEKSDDVCTEQCVSACQCPKYTVLESADGDVCLRMKECRKRRKDDDDTTFWGFDDDGEDWYADKRKKTDDDDERSSAASSSSSSSNTSDGPLVDGAGLTLGCVLVAGILIGAVAMRVRQSSKRPPTVELGQVIVAEEIPKDLEPRTDLQEPFPSVAASTPTARPV